MKFLKKLFLVIIVLVLAFIILPRVDKFIPGPHESDFSDYDSSITVTKIDHQTYLKDLTTKFQASGYPINLAISKLYKNGATNQIVISVLNKINFYINYDAKTGLITNLFTRPQFTNDTLANSQIAQMAAVFLSSLVDYDPDAISEIEAKIEQTLDNFSSSGATSTNSFAYKNRLFYFKMSKFFGLNASASYIDPPAKDKATDEANK